MTPRCTIPDCSHSMYNKATGFCSMHYQRWHNHGDPHFHYHQRRFLKGAVGGHGYWVFKRRGQKEIRRCVLMAEIALGKPLPKGALVHHVDENKRNDVPGNLVICQDRGYHQYLHQRTRSYRACGNANWRKCVFCKTYDDPRNLRIYGNVPQHPRCVNAVHRERHRAISRALGRMPIKKLHDDDILDIYEAHINGELQRDIATRKGVNRSHISFLVNGKGKFSVAELQQLLRTRRTLLARTASRKARALA